mgnify:CR=1 FL=1
MISFNTYIGLNDKILLRSYKNRYVIFDVRNDIAYEVKKEMFRFLCLLDGTITIKDLITLANSEEEKIISLLKELINRNLIKLSNHKFNISRIQKVKHINAPFIRSVCWLITGKCYLKCKHCYMRTSYFYNYEPLLKEALHIVRQLIRANVLSVVITGGEPFTYKHLIKILKELIEYDIRIKGINTNASLITDDKIVILKSLTKNYFEPININISLDGLKFHDKFRGMQSLHKKVLTVIKKLVDHGFKVNINTCVTKNNIHELLELYEILKKLKIYSWRLDKPRDIGMWIFYKKSLETPLNQLLYFYHTILELSLIHI